MFKSWLVYLAVTTLTRSPLLGLLAVAFLWWGGSSWFLGRLWNPLGPLKERLRANQLESELRVNPANANVRTELGGLLATRAPARAAEVLTDVLRKCPELPLPAYYMGVAQLRLGNTEAGAEHIEAALRLRQDLKYGEPLVRLGDHYTDRGDHARALREYLRATDIHSSYAEAWYKAGRAAQALGDAARAKELYAEALASTDSAPAFKRRLDRPWRIRAWIALRRA